MKPVEIFSVTETGIMSYEVYPVETPGGTRFYAEVHRARDGKSWSSTGFKTMAEAMDFATDMMLSLPE